MYRQHENAFPLVPEAPDDRVAAMAYTIVANEGEVLPGDRNLFSSELNLDVPDGAIDSGSTSAD